MITLKQAMLLFQIANINNNNKSKTPATYIVGDSIIKEIKSWKLSDKINRQEKVIVKSFFGATTKCKSLNKQPDYVIIHTGSNGIVSEQTKEQISDSIVHLAITASELNTVIAVSGIVSRGDGSKIKESE